MENKLYSKQLKRVDKSFLKRPNEIIKSNENGNLKLTFKSSEFDDKELLITKNSLLSKSPLINNTEFVEDSLSEFIVDFNNSLIYSIILNQNKTINNIINYKNGTTYNIFVKQDNIGNHELIFSNEINNMVFINDKSLNSDENSYTLYNIIVVDDILYVKTITDYKLIT